MKCVKGLIRVYSKNSGTNAYIAYNTSCENAEALAAAQAKNYRDYLDKQGIISEDDDEIPSVSNPVEPTNPNVYHEIGRGNFVCLGIASVVKTTTAIDGRLGLILSGRGTVSYLAQGLISSGIRYSGVALNTMDYAEPVIPPEPDINRSFYNIEEYGALVGQDITSVLQTAFNFSTHKTTIYIPGSYYYLSDTISTPIGFGGSIFGAGSGGVENKANDSSVARLIWIGTINKPMLRIRGGGFNLEGGLTLDGKDYLASPRATTGILIDTLIPGNNSTFLSSIKIMNCDTLFKIAQTESSSVNQIFIKNLMTGGDCNTVYEINHNNTTNTISYLSHQATSTTTFNLLKDSTLSLFNVYCNKSTNFLNIPNTADNSMNRIQSIENLAIDTLDNTFKVVNCEKTNCQTKVVINDLTISRLNWSENNEYLFKVRDGMNLTLFHSYGLQQSMIYAISSTYKPAIYLERCMLQSTNLMKSDSTSYYLNLRNCIDVNFVPITDSVVTI